MVNELKLISKNINILVNITEITSAFRLVLPSDYRGKYELHAPIEFMYCDSGSQTLYDSSKKHVINGGQAFFRKPYAVHKDDTNGVQTTLYVINFKCDSESILQLYGKVLTLSDSSVVLLKNIFELLQKEKQDDTSNQFIFSGMITPLGNEPSKTLDQKIKNKLELLFLDLLDMVAGENREQKKNYSKSTMMVINELESQIYGKFNLDAVSANLFYSKSYLCRKFKEDVGLTINQYFYEKKIAEAKTLLIKNTMSLQEISSLLSFESVQYFDYIFKKYVGVSPKQWQKLAINSH